MENNIQGTTTNLGGQIVQPNTGVQNSIPQAPVMNNIPTQPVGVPYTPENPTNAGVVTNSVAQAAQQQVNDQAAANVVYTTTTTGNPVVQPVQNVQQPLQQPVTSGFVQTLPQQPQPEFNVTTTDNPPVTVTLNEQGQQPTVTVEEEKVEEQKEPVVMDKVMINVKNLQEITAQAKKLAVCETIVPLTTIIYMEINREGIKLTAFDGARTIEIIDRSRSYTQEIKISVDAYKFASLVSALDDGEVEIIYNEEQQFITLKTDTGAFQFAQSVDLNTGMTLTLKHEFTVDPEQMIPLDYNKFLSELNLTKPIRDLARSTPEAWGVYFKDLIMSSDSNLILLQENLPELRDTEFFLESKFLELITSINFNSDTCKIGFVRNVTSGEIEGIVVTDGNITISGKTKENTFLPVDVCEKYWNTEFPIKVTLDTRKCCKLLKRVAPFVDKLTDKEYSTFQIHGDTLQVIALSGEARDVLDSENKQSYENTIKLPLLKLLAVLEVIDTPTYNLSVNPEQDGAVCIEFNSYKCIVAIG